MDNLTKSIINDVRVNSTYTNTYIDNLSEDQLLTLKNSCLQQVINLITTSNKDTLLISAPYPHIFNFLVEKLGKKYIIATDVANIKFPSTGNILIKLVN